VSSSADSSTQLDGEVAALLRRYHALPYRHQLAAAVAIARYLEVEPAVPGLEAAAVEQREAIAVLEAATAELGLPAGTAPTARAFNGTKAARLAGWNSTRIARVFGRWNFAVDRLMGKPVRQSAAQRGAERASKRGVRREREDYLCGLRLWLDSDPPSLTAYDYDAWRAEYNAKLNDGERALVSYSRLRQAFRCRWRDLIEVARGRLSLADAEARARSGSLVRDEGPDQLIGFAEVRTLLGLGSTTATRNMTYSRGFPAPVYVHPRGAKQRLWRRPDVDAFIAGRPTSDPGVGSRERYLDAHAVADALGLAVITVTTRSSPRVPAPVVRGAGLQLWSAEEVAEAAGREKRDESDPVLPDSADGHLQQPQPRDPRPHPSDREAASEE
jgi:hypothetical protein